MKPDQKKLIINYCKKNAGIQGFRETGLLSYYLDHQNEIDISTLAEQEKAEQVIQLQKVIEEANMQLRQIASPDEIKQIINDVKINV